MTWDQIKEAPPIPRKRRIADIVKRSLILQGKKFRASLLPCKWTSETNQNGWFYITTAHNLEGYILYITDNLQPLSIIGAGLVLEFLNLRQVAEDGHNIYQTTFKNYVKHHCK